MKTIKPDMIIFAIMALAIAGLLAYITLIQAQHSRTLAGRELAWQSRETTRQLQYEAAHKRWLARRGEYEARITSLDRRHDGTYRAGIVEGVYQGIYSICWAKTHNPPYCLTYAKQGYDLDIHLQLPMPGFDYNKIRDRGPTG